jgi:hypothetical protein
MRLDRTVGERGERVAVAEDDVGAPVAVVAVAAGVMASEAAVVTEANYI